ncbi:hypothetical protein QRX50_14665 [Amycolatopsis carbonis]|uniref:Uncharacterized protein n=1 Tax=Amycolatopsis carbonis TaxID=715471 RepID=A0A9Y2MYR9_9PSEU|nr:hypothetical protein [Amycolatopsis sp. 2-15]WIX81908.1 hypothetical protein QRX50_14665 [Amycolatopsis sp. 2-15]
MRTIGKGVAALAVIGGSLAFEAVPATATGTAFTTQNGRVVNPPGPGFGTPERGGDPVACFLIDTFRRRTKESRTNES